MRHHLAKIRIEYRHIALEDDGCGQLLILETSSRLLASHCQAPAAPTGYKSNKQVVAN